MSLFAADHIDQLINELDRVLPVAFTRSWVEKCLGGMFTKGYLAQLDSEGKGPEGSFRNGRHICYIKHFF